MSLNIFKYYNSLYMHQKTDSISGVVFFYYFTEKPSVPRKQRFFSLL